MELGRSKLYGMDDKDVELGRSKLYGMDDKHVELGRLSFMAWVIKMWS